ncbi:acetyl-CoA carboxylase biotin carboxyl carrier protein [Albimonas sp. CAU 1670]|uniref:acetyl-CoA carboxylase biotin carboxyl carrier protein n=1 Tax=Albimonas sp. CAU 1670 TaxID=3032599 RepID=UPI0023DC09EF|nr:acetyl-CoA carboxylase biotin carboxyl carrier protein [Albimonas sp. CAU 1670]MDF2232532.1 acetyl-CoA carboxylase biotin carboxyl carrier protein [Albimonas sp. CAU 1670]
MSKHHEADIAFIRSLAELLRETELTEIEVEREYGEDDQLKVRVTRQLQVAAPVQVAVPAAAPAPAAAAAPAPAEATGDAADDLARHPGAVASPMVGTVYLQAEPGAPSFVRVGDQVSEGQTLLIVEAMKTMNQIPSPRAGTVKRILVTDGTPVEFGAPLMIIE